MKYPPLLYSSLTNQNYNHLLSSCKQLTSLLQIHGRILTSGLQNDTATTTHLVNFYSLFNKSDSARNVFDSMPKPSLILYNSLIRGYNRSYQYKEALKVYDLMLFNGLEPDKHTFTFVLKACTGDFNSELGCLIHREVMRRGLECDVFIGTALVDMYCKLGHLKCAASVFDKLTNKDVAAWNAMIAGHSQSEEPGNALHCFRTMQLSGVEVNSVSLLNLFPAVCKLLDIKSCKCIHGYVVRRGCRTVVSNGIIDMYSKCGNVGVARHIFDRMWGRDDVSWGTIMAGYVYNGHYIDVLELFDRIIKEGLKINKVSAVSGFLAAGEMNDLEKGKEIFECAMKQSIDSDIMVATALVTMFVKCGEIEKAKKLFDGLQGRDIVSWSALISTFVQSGYDEEAFSLFWKLQKQNLNPNMVTLISIIPACAELSYLKLGKSVHCYAIKANMVSNISIETALVSMYAKCGSFTQALIIFNSMMPCNDIVTWNSLINGYAQTGDPYNTMSMFHKLKLASVHPDTGTIVGVVSACGLLRDMGQATCIQGQIIKTGFELDSRVNNALIDMYAKCGSVASAKVLFNQAHFAKDKVSWNVLIAAYVRNGLAKEAILAFQQMKVDSFQPNTVTIVSILPAAADLADLAEGMMFHACIVRIGVHSNVVVRNSLIDMYAKCGRLDYSEIIFNEMESKDTVSWNTMLAAYAMHGHGESAINLFTLMQESNACVDSVSLINILSACRHSGLVEEGRKIFESMSQNHSVQPVLEHYACIVDLLGGSGLFDEIMDLIKSMTMEPDAAVWGALLSACRIHCHVELAEIAVDHLIKLEPGNPTHYVVLSGMYARSGRWDDARNMRLKMKEAGLNKIPACSWI